MTQKKPIADILKENRKARKWSQQQAANKISIKRCTYAKYEEGRSFPSIELIFRLAEVFGYSSLDLFLQTNKPANTNSNAAV
jgi:transcriptional regulator with XRE-family HTH domain